ncbi:MAG: inorganic phosphate transporter [Lawsonibacter sp.]|nr:inorganic phosphate transporter [Lawsonibacter sp.]
MPLSFAEFLAQLSRSPALAATVLLTLAVLLVNGWTDAPNAIACAVVTGALPFRRAVLLAAACNFLGVVCVTAAQPAVARTVYSIAQFSGGPKTALCALCAAMAAIVLWAAAAWLWGIPTSESHALVAGVSGAAVALEGGFGCIRWDSWAKVLLGLVLSAALGLFAGRAVWRALASVPLPPALCRRLQIPGAALSAFLHGAQDGQKLLGIFLLGCALAAGRQDEQTFWVPLWAMALCALFMALGTGLGGRRIIRRIGQEMVTLSPRDGLCCDLAGGACLLLATLLGLPVSTTHTRTSALLGVGQAAGGPWDRRVARSIAAAWLLTFPCCFAMGFLFSRLLLNRL